jgi:hypothetical protein
VAIDCGAVVGLRVRLTTAFNRILQLPGASVHTVAFTDQGLVIGLRRRRRRLRCPCGATTRARYDSSRRRWRHLDFGACQVWLEANIHRVDCRACGRVRTEQVPWARPNARHTSDFENVVAWLAHVLLGHAHARGRVPFDLPSSTQAVVDSRTDTPYDTAGPLFHFGDGIID